MYSFALGGSDWQMVPCMVTFLHEVRDCVDAGLLNVTNLGQIGDARHQAEPTSRHNPAKAPDGNWYVCAADFGGTDYSRLADFHQALYRAHDPRIYNHGFCQWGDGYGLSWYDGGREWTGRDQGHCHFDVTMRNASLSSDWWMDSLASTAPWGLADYLRTGQLTTQSGNATPIPSEEDEVSAAVDKIMAAIGDTLAGVSKVWDRLDAITPGKKTGRPPYYTIANGQMQWTWDRTTPGAITTRLLDNGDGNTIVLAIRALADKVAAGDTALTAQLNELTAQLQQGAPANNPDTTS